MDGDGDQSRETWVVQGGEEASLGQRGAVGGGGVCVFTMW